LFLDATNGIDSEDQIIIVNEDLFFSHLQINICLSIFHTKVQCDLEEILNCRSREIL